MTLIPVTVREEEKKQTLIHTNVHFNNSVTILGNYPTDGFHQTCIRTMDSAAVRIQ